MSLETAKRGIDFVAENARRQGVGRIGVSYHGGGEPTVHWKCLTASFDYALEKTSELDLTLSSSLATNGVLSDRKLEWIIANVEDITVSCDGLPTVHDASRPTAEGRGSSKSVLRSLRHFDEACLAYGIRMTVTSQHITSLPESVVFLCSEFQPKLIQVEPVYLLGRGRLERSAETDEFIEAFRQAHELAAPLGGKIVFSGARVGTLTNHFCSVSEDNFSLSVDGNVTACHEAFSEEAPQGAVFFYGRPASGPAGYSFDFEVLGHLREQAVENREYCRRCFARWSCGGDCYYKWRASSTSAQFNGSARCHIIRELTKEQILEKISASGGLVWHDPPAWPEQDGTRRKFSPSR
jgi:uncharacterized protein